MIEFIGGVVIVLLAGYIIAHNHYRIRSLAVAITAGTVVGEAMPAMPDDVDHDHRSDERYPHIDDGHTHGGDGGGVGGHSLDG
jgi:hypothetical protein